MIANPLNTVFRIERDFSDLLQPIFLALFTWSLLAISGAMLIFQMQIVKYFFFSKFRFVYEEVLWFQMYHGDVVLVLLNASLNGVIALTAVFIACELSQRMNDAFDGIDATIAQFDWYLFPIKIQRTLPMIIANAQQPVTLECFGSIVCSRQVFGKVGIKQKAN